MTRRTLILQAIAARNEGLTWSQVRDAVAPEMRTTTLRAAVIRHCKAHGGDLLTSEPRKQRAWTTRDLKRVADARRAGAQWKDCGALVGVSAQAAQHALRWSGITIGPDEVAPPQHPRQELVRRAVAERNGTGDSWSTLAARVGWPKTPGSLQAACAKYCRRQGLTLKPGRFGLRRPGGAA